MATDLQRNDPTDPTDPTDPGPTGPRSTDLEPADLESTDWERYRELLSLLTASARRAGRAAVVSGRWLGTTVADLAPRVPLRDVETLSRHHDGLTGPELARSMVRSAARVSGTIGAATGGMVALQELSVAGAMAIPFELAAETALVVLVEVKLVAELHRVAGRPFAGNARDQMAGALRSWLSGRGLSSPSVVVAPARLDLLGRATRRQLNQRLRQRFTRNLTTLGPLLTGAVAAGWLNRRATRAIGRRLLRDLDLT